MAPLFGRSFPHSPLIIGTALCRCVSSIYTRPNQQCYSHKLASVFFSLWGCVDMYLHNYTGDVLGTDISSVRVIGVSTLFSRHQTGPVHLMWSFWFIFPAAFGCHSYPQPEICPIYVTSKCFSRSFSNHSQT